jgi:hypothetical protein
VFPFSLTSFAALNAGRLPRFQAGGPVGGGGTETIRVSINQIAQAIEQNTTAINSQSTVIQELGRIVQDLSTAVGNLVKTVANLVTQQGELMKAVNAALQRVARPAEKAAGGLIGGRGTGTSDSNLAWLSRGEYVVPARAVAQPGVLALLEGLRGGLGRLLPGPLPAFAAGGLAGMSHVTIAFPGLPPVSGLRASASVVDELRRSAAMAQVRSGGRKPSRYS